MKKADLRNTPNNTPKNVCVSTNVVYPDPLSPTPSVSSALKSQENTDEDPSVPQPADEEDIQMEYSPG